MTIINAHAPHGVPKLFDVINVGVMHVLYPMPCESAENIRASLRAIRTMNLVLLWTVVTFTAIVQAQDDRPGKICVAMLFLY